MHDTRRCLRWSSQGYSTKSWLTWLNLSSRGRFVSPNDAPIGMITLFYAQLNPLFCNGNVRILFPVAAKIAFPTAGKIGGSVGSPKPVGAKFDLIQKTSIG